MQSYALTVDKFLDHAAKWCGGSRNRHGEARAASVIAALRARSNRLSGALQKLGLRRATASAPWPGIPSTIWRSITARWARAYLPHAQSAPDRRPSGGNGERGREPRAGGRRGPGATWRAQLVPQCPEHRDRGADGWRGLEPRRSVGGRKTFALRDAARRAAATETAWGEFDEETPAGPLLYFGHHRRAQGRALYAPFQLSAYLARAAGRCRSR